MELQYLRIDNYIEWYRQLSINLFVLDLRKIRYKRLNLLSFSLHARHIRNPENTKSKELSEDFMNAAKELENLINKVEQFKELGIYYIPSLQDWNNFDFMRKTGLESLKENLAGKISQSALPEIEILKNELKRKNAEDIKYLNNYTTGTAIIINADSNEMSDRWFFDLSNEVSNIDYCVYIADRIKKLENPAPENEARLQWNGTAKDFSELIKALSLTVLKGMQETEIIKILGNVFEINGKPFNEERHRINVNELQDKKPADMLTAKLNKEMNNYLKSLIETQR